MPSGRSPAPCARIAMSWMVTAADGSPLTWNLPFSQSKSATDTSSIPDAMIFALSQTLRATRRGRARAGRGPAAVGAEPERRLVGVAVPDVDVVGRDAQFLGDNLGER